MKTALLIGIALIGVATVLGVISTAIPYWLTFSSETASLHQGLWQICGSFLSISEKCSDVSIQNAPDWLRAVQALTIIGIVFLALGAVFAGFYLKNESQTKYSAYSTLTSVTGGVLFAVAVIIYGAKYKDTMNYSQVSLGAGFYLGIVTAIAAFLAALALHHSKRAPGYSSI